MAWHGRHHVAHITFAAGTNGLALIVVTALRLILGRPPKATRLWPLAKSIHPVANGNIFWVGSCNRRVPALSFIFCGASGRRPKRIFLRWAQEYGKLPSERSRDVAAALLPDELHGHAQSSSRQEMLGLFQRLYAGADDGSKSIRANLRPTLRTPAGPIPFGYNCSDLAN